MRTIPFKVFCSRDRKPQHTVYILEAQDGQGGLIHVCNGCDDMNGAPECDACVIYARGRYLETISDLCPPVPPAEVPPS